MPPKPTKKHATRPAKRLADARAAILDAAARSFADAGLAGARTEGIAAAAGVNKALLYYYFKSKESLFQAVIEEHFEGFNREALELLASPGSARAVLLEYAGMHFDFLAMRLRYAPLYQHLMMTGGKPLGRLVQKYIVPRSNALGKLLERGMRDGEFRKAERTHAAVSIAALTIFYFSAGQVLQRLGPIDAYSKANLRRRRREMLDFIRYGLFANPEAPIP